MDTKKRTRNDSDKLVNSAPEAKKSKETMIEELNETRRLLENELGDLKQKYARTKEDNAQDAKILEERTTIHLLKLDITFYQNKMMKSPIGRFQHWKTRPGQAEWERARQRSILFRNPPSGKCDK